MSGFIEGIKWAAAKLAASRFATEFMPPVLRRLRAYGELMRVHKPIGTLLLLWPALWALWFASFGRPNEQVFVVFVLGAFFTRSAGCVINDFADRNVDPHVERTKDRPLAAKRVTSTEAVVLFVTLASIALSLALMLDPLAQKLAFAGAAMIVTYPFMKRFFPAPQLYLGMAFAWSIPMAYAAQTGELPRIAWLLFIAGILWTAAYDTMYAMVDRDDDVKIGVKSTAILFGSLDKIAIGVMQAMTLLALWLAGRDMHMDKWYAGGLGMATLLALYQQYLIRNREPAQCFRAFLNNHYFGMIVFLGIALDYLFRA